jgi:hypothetical protein
VKHATRAALLALITASVAPAAHAQSTDEPTKAEEPTAKPAKRPARRRAAVDLPRATGPVATFPGYQALPDGRTQIYVEITSTVPVAESSAAGTITYRLKGARVTVHNNKNALITTHFPATPVARARLVSAEHDLNLIIELRANVAATYRMVSSEAGTARLEVEFPAGQYPTEPLRFMPPPKAAGEKPTKEADIANDTVDEQPEKPPPTAKPKKKPAKPKARGMGPPAP